MVGGGGGTLYDIFGVRCLFTNRTCFFRISRKKDSERERGGGGGSSFSQRTSPQGNKKVRWNDRVFCFLGCGGGGMGGGKYQVL